jgi:hypothetical protein
MAQDPNEKLEKQGNTTKGNMGEGRIEIDMLDKLMKRGKYAPEKKETLKEFEEKTRKTILNEDGMFAEGYSEGVKKKLNKIDKSNTPIRKLKKDILPKAIDQRDLVGSEVYDLPEYKENKFSNGYKKGLQDAADAANKGGRSRKIKLNKGGAVHTMPDGKKMKGAKHGMKHGGAVKGKKCRMDGIAIRGKTRAKERSK